MELAAVFTQARTTRRKQIQATLRRPMFVEGRRAN